MSRTSYPSSSSSAAGGGGRTAPSSSGTNFPTTPRGRVNPAMVIKPGISNMIIAIDRDDVAEIERIIPLVDDLNSTSGHPDHFTALHYAAKKGSLIIMEKLISAGANIEIKNPKLKTPLYVAIENGKLDAVNFLIERGADITFKSVGCMCPLQFAIKAGSLDIFNRLIDAGADIRRGSPYELTHEATLYGQTEIFDRLIDLGAPISFSAGLRSIGILHKACIRGNEHIFDRMISLRGYSINQKCSLEGKTPLHYAAENGHTRIVQKLISLGANINEKSDETGETALHFAAKTGRSDTIKLLIEFGCDIEAQTKEFKTALDLSKAAGGHTEMMYYFGLRSAIRGAAEIPAAVRSQLDKLHDIIDVVKLALRLDDDHGRSRVSAEAAADSSIVFDEDPSPCIIGEAPRETVLTEDP